MQRFSLTLSIFGESVSDCQARRPSANDDIVILRSDLLGAGENVDMLGILRGPSVCQLRSSSQI